ncbi:MAG: cobalt transporter CbiM [Chloroflexi bacterium]|nr:cobalt transporter CbiM [Chloroflexota bacterium]
MHIPDGILTPAAAIGGYVVAGAVTWYSLRKIQQQPDPEAQIPKAALMTAAFFVASWIHIPVPPTSVHLVLNGLMGVVLGWYAFPAMLVGLFLQAIMFQHGGLTTLGVNVTMMGLPALAAFFIFQLRTRFHLTGPVNTAIFAFLGGGLGLGLGALLAFTILITSIPTYIDVAAEQAAITALSLAHVPLAIIEGVFTVLIVSFLLRVRPEMLDGHAPAH